MLTGLASPVGQGALELNVTLQAPYQIQSDQHANTMTIEILFHFPISPAAPGPGEKPTRAAGPSASRPPQATVQRMHVHTVGVARSHPLWQTAIHFDLLSSPALQWLGVGGRALLQHGGDRPRELRLLPAGLDRTRSPHFAPAVPRDSRAREVAAAPTSQAAWRRRRGVQPTLVRVARRGERFPRRG